MTTIPRPRDQSRDALAVGQRVYVRRPTTDDCEALIALARASRPLHGRFASPPATVPEVEAWLAKGRGIQHEQFLVCLREDDAIAGVININEIVRGCFQSGYLGYYAFVPHAGRGYMTEGLQLVLRYAFRTLRLHRLEANIQPDNAASIALVERLGFRREGYSPRYLKLGGRWRDHERWAILAEEG
jgi:ribosomal-protein-alanine N-acetyltransferase